MHIRTITLCTEPSIQHVLYFKNHENAKRTEVIENSVLITDDFGKTVSYLRQKCVSDEIVHLEKNWEALEDVKVAELTADMRLSQRLQGNEPLKQHVMRIQAAKNPPRGMPPGMVMMPPDTLPPVNTATVAPAKPADEAA